MVLYQVFTQFLGSDALFFILKRLCWQVAFKNLLNIRNAFIVKIICLEDYTHDLNADDMTKYLL